MLLTNEKIEEIFRAHAITYYGDLERFEHIDAWTAPAFARAIENEVRGGVCNWKRFGPIGSIWVTGCPGDMHSVITDVNATKYTYCPFCGRKAEVE